MKYFVFAFLIFLHFQLFAQRTDTLYKIYDVSQAKLVTLDELVAKANKVSVVFFGEDHNDSVAHAIELQLTKKLADKANDKLAVSMEMFHTDLQPVLNEYTQGLISEKNFLKEVNPWPNYTDYKPIVEFAKSHRLTIIGGNVATRYSNAVTMGGLEVLQKFPKTSKLFLPPLPIDTAVGAYSEKFNQTLGGHSMGGMKIYQTQNLWDASMAWSIARYLKEHPKTQILQINGRFHSDEKLGAVAKLKLYRPKVKLLTISCFSEDDFVNPKWAKYINLADYIILTNPTVARSY